MKKLIASILMISILGLSTSALALHNPNIRHVRGVVHTQHIKHHHVIRAVSATAPAQTKLAALTMTKTTKSTTKSNTGGTKTKNTTTTKSSY